MIEGGFLELLNPGTPDIAEIADFSRRGVTYPRKSAISSTTPFRGETGPGPFCLSHHHFAVHGAAELGYGCAFVRGCAEFVKRGVQGGEISH